MDRKLAILLSLCLGLVCVFVNHIGRQSLSKTTDGQPEAALITCQKLLHEWPKDNFHLQLTKYRRGRHFASYDHDKDGNWELVYVPLFPDHIQKLGNNFSSVIVYFDDVRNQEELDERLTVGKLDSQLWYTQQDLPSDVHSDLAHQYRLMDFSKCVVLQGGYTPPSPLIGKSAIMASYLGLIASGIVFIWNFLAMLIPARRPRDHEEEKPSGPVTNRAGLPDF